MTFLRKLLAGLLNLLVMSVLLFGSCVGSVGLFVQSPRWSLEPYDAEKSRSFFVAFSAKDNQGQSGIHVLPYERKPAPQDYSDIQYRLPDGRHHESRSDQEQSSTIQASTEPDGSQLVKIFVMGETPWSSMSEYRVKDNQVQPLRHAHANPWLLLGILAGLVGVHYLMKPIRRSINRMVGLEQNNPSLPSG
jgi:hypothetical protein